MQLKKIHKSPIKHFLSNNDSIVLTASNELHAGYGSLQLKAPIVRCSIKLQLEMAQKPFYSNKW